VPLIEGLEKAGAISLIPTVPSRIADLVRADEADLGLCSLVDLLRGDLTALTVGMIGCDGPTLTVRLFSSVPLARIEQVHADTDSHTSVVLCRVLLRMLHGTEPPVVDFDARERIALGPNAASSGPVPLEEAWPQTVLLIGDKVV